MEDSAAAGTEAGPGKTPVLPGKVAAVAVVEATATAVERTVAEGRMDEVSVVMAAVVIAVDWTVHNLPVDATVVAAAAAGLVAELAVALAAALAVELAG